MPIRFIYKMGGITMPNEEEIKKMAYDIWEKEGRPYGKDQEYYYRAQKTLEEQEIAKPTELAQTSPTIESELKPPVMESSQTASINPTRSVRHKRK